MVSESGRALRFVTELGLFGGVHKASSAAHEDCLIDWALL